MPYASSRNNNKGNTRESPLISGGRCLGNPLNYKGNK